MEDLRLIDLVASDILQEVQDLIVTRDDIALGISSSDGEYLTSECQLNEFCECYIKQSPEGKRRCDACDCENAMKAQEKGVATAYKCHAGLTDFTAPINVDGKLYGFIVGGQVCTEPLTREQTDQIAKELELDPDGLYEASKKTKIINQQQLEDTLVSVNRIANIVTDIAINKYNVLMANQEIGTAAKMKSDFLANMSHEIRTPMNAIIGMADMALREDLPEDARNYISQIKRSGKVLLTIINDILDFSKIESGKMDITMTEYSPMRLIDDVAHIIQTRTKGKDIELILDVDPNLPGRLMGDDVRIKQIITNLANNAIKFTPKGQVCLQVYCQPTAPMTQKLYVAVKDTGIGIKKEDMKKIFESFQQVDSKRNRNIEGTGLGLAISKQLIELMDGTLKVESEYEVGSTFSFCIPQLELQQEESDKVENPEHIKALTILRNQYVQEQLIKDIVRMGGQCGVLQIASEMDAQLKQANYLFTDTYYLREDAIEYFEEHPQLSVVVLLDFDEEFECTLENVRMVRKPLYTYNLTKLFMKEEINIDKDEEESVVYADFTAPDAKVLVVDDNEVNLSVCTGLMKPLKMQVKTAISGIKAVEMISDEHFDIIFMDHMMPEMDGVETTHIIRRMHPEYDNVPIIALTANAIEEAKSMFLVEGMNDFMAKPIAVKTLFDMLKNWLPQDKIIPLANDELIQEQEVQSDLLIPGLDVESALNLVGEQSIYLEVITNYYKSIDKKYHTIKQACESQDWENYTIEVHALKSASRQIGAMELGSFAERLEHAGHEHDIAMIQNGTEELLKEYIQMKSLLEPYVMKKNEVELVGVADARVTKEILECIASALDDLDSTALEHCIEQLRQYEFDERQQSYLESMAEAVESFDFDACDEILDKWKNCIE